MAENLFGIESEDRRVKSLKPYKRLTTGKKNQRDITIYMYNRVIRIYIHNYY